MAHMQLSIQLKSILGAILSSNFKISIGHLSHITFLLLMLIVTLRFLSSFNSINCH